jgi:nitroreductase
VITSRHCKRAFVDQAVSPAILIEILRAAAHAPSSRNAQMWRVAVVTGETREMLAQALCTRFDEGIGPQPDYSNRAVTLDGVVEERARAAAKGVLLAKGTDGRSQAARRAYLRDNLRCYGAPVVMIFHLPRSAAPGTFLEMGFFPQNVMLGLVARGLGSCPQYSVAGYGDVICAELKLGTDRLIACSLAVGYADETAPVNRFVPERAPLKDYVQWHD